MIKRVKKIIKLKNIKVLSRELSDHFYLSIINPECLFKNFYNFRKATMAKEGL